MKKNAVLAAFLLLLMPLFGCAPPCGHPPAEKAALTLPFWAPGAGNVERRFELAKRSEPELIIFLRRMPKGADLHNHLTGATYSEYLLRSARKNGLNYDLRTNLFTQAPPKAGAVVTPDDLVAHSDELAQFLNTFSMRGWFPNTTSGHDHFFQTFGHIHSAGRARNEMLAEVVARNAYENVEYLELMTSSTPQVPGLIEQFTAKLPPAVADRFARADLDRDSLEAAAAVLRPLLRAANFDSRTRALMDAREQGVEAILAAKYQLHITGPHPDVVVRYIPELHREAGPTKFFVEAMAVIEAIQSDPRIVAMNIVAPEDDPRSLEYFHAQMQILDYLWGAMGHPNIALHAGELVLKESPVEPMRDRISQSILEGHARRIGHGVSVAWENDPVGLLEYMKAHGVSVEICLSSNESILGVTGRAHPFILYRRAGVPVTLDTDDEGISRSNLTMEYVKAVERYNLGYRDLKTLARNSLEYAFLPGQGLFVNGDYAAPRPGFDGVDRPAWTPGPEARRLMQENLKLRMQVRLERAFVDFETSLNEGFGAGK